LATAVGKFTTNFDGRSASNVIFSENQTQYSGHSENFNILLLLFSIYEHWTSGKRVAFAWISFMANRTEWGRKLWYAIV